MAPHRLAREPGETR